MTQNQHASTKRNQRKKTRKQTTSDKLFLFINWTLLIAFSVIIVYPLLFILSASFSAGSSIMSLSLLPNRFSLAGYLAVFQYKDIWTGYGNSILYMILGTFISLLLTIFCAYPVSRPDFKGGGFLMILCMITMYFSGGNYPNVFGGTRP